MTTSTTHEGTTRISDTRDASPTADALRTENRRREIERISPEGRPAHPEMGSSEISWLVLFGVIFVLVLSVAFAAIAGIAAGAVVLAFGLGIAVLMNPEIWASLLRANERDRSESTGAARQRSPSYRANKPLGGHQYE